jgi:hypothetical protein
LRSTVGFTGGEVQEESEDSREKGKYVQTKVVKVTMANSRI